jgi:hypothetical protein
MADGLNLRERTIVLLALWNHRMNTGRLHATVKGMSDDQAVSGRERLAEIDRVAARLGGDPHAPNYGLGALG